MKSWNFLIIELCNIKKFFYSSLERMKLSLIESSLSIAAYNDDDVIYGILLLEKIYLIFIHKAILNIFFVAWN